MPINDIPYWSDLPLDVRTYIARILLVILALLLIWAMRRTMTLMIIRPVRHILKRTGRDYDEAMLNVIAQPARYLIIAIGILISSEILEISASVNAIANQVGRSLIILALLVFAQRLIDLLTPTSNRLFAITGVTIEERLLPFLRTAVKLIVISIGVVIVFQEWNYDISGLVAGLGLGGLAFSLAAQSTIANLFGFVSLVSDRPFNVGEFIKTPDVEGIVEHVGLRSTQVRCMDQSLMYVPNNVMAQSAILNWSRLRKRRIDYVLGIDYSATSEQMRVLLHRIRELLKTQPTIDPNSVVVYFTNFTENGLEILIRAYVHLADWGEFTAEQERLNLEILDIVRDLNLELAAASQNISIDNLSDFSSSEQILSLKPKFTAEEKAIIWNEEQDAPQELKQDAEPKREDHEHGKGHRG